MRLRRTRYAVVALAVAGSVTPFALGANASAARPVFRQYESPVGAKGADGLPYTGLPHTGNYSQAGIGDSCGEPTVGVDRKTGAVMYQCGLQTLRVSNFDMRGPGTATWTDVTGLL